MGLLGSLRCVFPLPLNSVSRSTHHRRSTRAVADAREQINVWFTGHSLGCATASLVYCRHLMRPKDLGKKAILRDSYLFACPILTDRETVDGASICLGGREGGAD